MLPGKSASSPFYITKKNQNNQRRTSMVPHLIHQPTCHLLSLLFFGGRVVFPCLSALPWALHCIASFKIQVIVPEIPAPHPLSGIGFPSGIISVSIQTSRTVLHIWKYSLLVLTSAPAVSSAFYWDSPQKFSVFVSPSFLLLSREPTPTTIFNCPPLPLKQLLSVTSRLLSP